MSGPRTTAWIESRPGKPLDKQYSVTTANLDKLVVVMQFYEKVGKPWNLLVYSSSSGAITTDWYKGFPRDTVIIDCQAGDLLCHAAAEGTDTWTSAT